MHKPNGNSGQRKETDLCHASYPSGTSPYYTSTCDASQSGESP